jgi:hypothetical protein
MSGKQEHLPKILVNRRVFCATGIRLVLAAGLTLVGLVLGWRTLGPNAARCQTQPLCDECRLLNGCRKPQALAFRAGKS